MRAVKLLALITLGTIAAAAITAISWISIKTYAKVAPFCYIFEVDEGEGSICIPGPCNGFLSLLTLLRQKTGLYSLFASCACGDNFKQMCLMKCEYGMLKNKTEYTVHAKLKFPFRICRTLVVLSVTKTL